MKRPPTMERRPARGPASGLATRRAAVTALPLALAVLLAGASGCARKDPAEIIRLVSAPPGVLAPVYTVAAQTRPVLATPPEIRLQLNVPPGASERFTFALPPDTDAKELIATGGYQRDKRVHSLAPQLVEIAQDAAGNPQTTIALPIFARGPGPPTSFTLVLTPPPATSVVETRVGPVSIPRDARLHFAYALSEAARIAGAAKVTLEVYAAQATTPEEAGSGDEESASGGGQASADTMLWSTTCDPRNDEARRWREATIDLEGFAGRRIILVFLARAHPEGRQLALPLWGDPTIVAPAVRPATRRNVILVSLDTLRADRVGAYGAYRPTTPALDALAAESVLFTNAWAPWPETSGSHMSLFTSRYPSEHGVTSFITAPSASVDLLAERLRREGYLTRAFTENGGVWADAGFARGFSAYSERRSPDFVYRGEAAATFRAATRWVETHAERTFFLFVHTYQVHEPYSPPRQYRQLFADIPGREPVAMVANAVNYDRETRFTDDQLGPFIETLRRLGLADRSIVIVTSDHGEEFGEHGGKGHGRTLHREVLHVPLIVWAPGMLGAARVAAPASLIDLAPTVLDLLGLAPDPGHRGISLRAAARGDDTLAARPIFGELDRVERRTFRMLSVRKGGRTAISDLDQGTTRCYGADDPGERQPAEDCPDLAALIAEHRSSMVPIGSLPVQESDPQLVEKMRALGYIE